jgi:hypothetical protein
MTGCQCGGYREPVGEDDADSTFETPLDGPDQTPPVAAVTVSGSPPPPRTTLRLNPVLSMLA